MKQFLANFALEPFDVPMIVLGAVLFYIFCKLFGKHVVMPYMRLMEAREAATEGVVREAQAELRAAGELQHEFDARIQQARIAALAEKLKIVESAKKEGADLLKNAEDAARKILEEERGVLKQSLEEERSKASLEEESLVALVLQKLRNPGGTSANF